MLRPKRSIQCDGYGKMLKTLWRRVLILDGGRLGGVAAVTELEGHVPGAVHLGGAECLDIVRGGQAGGQVRGGDVEPERYNGRGDVEVWGIDQERDRTEIRLAQLAMTCQKPILAICRGLQVLNVALGGTLWEDVMSLIPGSLNHDLPDDIPRNHLAHTVTTAPDTLLSRCLGKSEVWVNSIHHQAIRDLASELVVTAVAPDNVIEAAEVPGHPFAVGVQWHPENLIHDDPAMLALFEGLVQAAKIQQNGQGVHVSADGF